MQMSGNSIARKVHRISAVTVNSYILLLRAILFYLFGRGFAQESCVQVLYTNIYVFEKNTIARYVQMYTTLFLKEYYIFLYASVQEGNCRDM